MTQALAGVHSAEAHRCCLLSAGVGRVPLCVRMCCSSNQGLCMPRLVYLVAQSEGRHFSLSAVDRRMGELYL